MVVFQSLPGSCSACSIKSRFVLFYFQIISSPDLKALKDILAKHTDAQELSDSDVDEIKAAKSKLETSAQKVFSAMYENMQQAQAGAQGGPAPDMGNMGGGAADNGASASDDAGPDVVDADYREV